MGYAPISSIAQVPTPADAGTVVHVAQDTGARFPEPPFLALVWPAQTVPRIGIDSEEPTVLSIDGDVFTVRRGVPAVAWTSDLQIAALSTAESYSIGEDITLVQEFAATDTGVTLSLRSPQGYIETPTLNEAVGENGGSAYTHSFEGSQSGKWFYCFASDQRVEPEQDFYVRYSEVY